MWSTLKKQDLVVATTTTDPKDARIQELEKENREKGKRIDELQAEIAASPEIPVIKIVRAFIIHDLSIVHDTKYFIL